MKKVLLTDVDGVLVDWVGSFGKYAQSRGYQLNTPTPKTWEMTEWFGADNDAIRVLIQEFNSGKDFESIPVFQDALKVLPELRRHYDLVAITCCSDDPKVISKRKKNLEMLNVDFKEIHCLPQTASKSDLLKSYSPTIWVEDRVEGAEAGHEAGHRSFLRESTYNNEYNNPEIKVVSGWEEILRLIRS
jgi:5'(3')-deoxyribonucleotidase